MLHQVRFCHLESIPKYSMGDEIHRGDLIGRMGSSGKSNAPHLHTDIIQAIEPSVYRLADIPSLITDIRVLMIQYHFLLDKELFDHPLHITSYFSDPGYGYYDENKIFHWEDHMAYDVVPEDRHKTTDHFYIFWPRSVKGRVISVGNDYAYGNYIMVAYED